jgi:signal transduction histidine kinase
MSLNGLFLILVILSGALVALSMIRPVNQRIPARWLSAFLIGATGLLVTLLLPDSWVLAEKLTPDFWVVVLAIVCVMLFGWLVIFDVSARKPIKRIREIWFGLSVVWSAGFIVSILLGEGVYEGWRTSLAQAPSVAIIFIFAGVLVMGALLMGVCSYAFYIAPLPEVANRSGYWLIVITALATSMILLTNGSTLFRTAGGILLLACQLVTLLAIYRHRLVDVRQQFLRSLRSVGIVVLAWSLILGVLYLIRRIDIADTPAGTVGLAMLALIVALLIIPINQSVHLLFSGFLRRTTPNLANATGMYSRNIALAPDLEAVIRTTNETLCNTVQIRKAALILVNNTYKRKDAVELIVLESGATMRKPSQKGFLSKKSPIYQTLAVEKVPLGQFDIDYGEAYRRVIPEERAFFGKLGMHAFVPIVAEANLIGLLACGGKLNDFAYTRDDMELLSVIGQQVGNALRNARLIDDLKHLNETMRELNKRLENAKIELEKMDSIKTDFVTIASHELRTPLAQIRGYTDIIDSLNEGGTLQKAQATQMVSNLRKSTERMEELIGAMIDVSQLDVNSMDLRFVRTSPETVIRMAIEPLKEALEQRKQTLDRNGLTGLPHVQADMQRLVQAFRNVILNAIKYTPDGGKIEISASLEKKTDGKDRILFAIRDTGIGIAEKDKELIFHKFYRGFDTQLHSTGMTKFLGAGPGLGLTITKGIVEGHGGEVWVESVGQDMEKFPGSTFYIRLPILPPEGQRLTLPFDEATVSDDKRKTSTIQVVGVKPDEETSLTTTIPDETAKASPSSDAPL